MRRKDDSKKLLYKSLSIFIAFLIGYVLFSYSKPESSSSSLSEAFSLLNSGSELKRARALFTEATESSLIAHWALIGQGQLALLENRPSDAQISFEQIQSDSPAYLDASIGLLRLEIENAGSSSDSKENLGQRLNHFEAELRQAKRHDLLPELRLLKALAAERNNNIPYALSLYREIRRLHPRTQASKEAKEAEQQILLKTEHSLSLAEILEDVSLLLSEGALDQALAKLQKAKEQIGPSAPVALEALSLEEKILRKSGRNEEADRMLAVISADGDLGSGDAALLQMAKNAWNTEEPDRALSFLSNFETRFKKSELIWEARYIRARILEEQLRLSEAKNVYKSLDTSVTPRHERARALRQLGWIFFREQEFLPSAKTFGELALLTRDQNPLASTTESPQASSSSSSSLDKKLREDHFHALYWQAVALSKLSETERADLEAHLNTQTLFSTLATQDRFGYYGLLAKEALKEQTQGEEKPEGSEQANSGECLITAPEELSSRLALLSTPELRQFARYEINWWLMHGESAEEDLKRELTRAQLYQVAGLGALSLGFLNSILTDFDSFESAKTKFAFLSACDKVVQNLRYPFPFREEFLSASSQADIPLSFMLAIARTESHFDPKARSHKDAIGLMQMLEKTAKEEGLEESEDLFSPEVNTRLGAKHLARLLARFDGNPQIAAAAYNAGSSATRRWLERYPKLNSTEWTELIGYPETKNYVKKVRLAEAGYALKIASAHPSTSDETP